MKYNETYFAELVASQKKYPEIFGRWNTLAITRERG